MEHKKTMLDYIADCPEFIRNNVADSAALTKPLVDDCNGLVQRKEPDAAAGTFRGGGHQALLQRVCSGQIIRNNNKVDTR